MSNLLKPFGIPSKAWARRQAKPSHGPTKQGPCQIHRQINGEPVYDELGAMPNNVGSWIATVKGTRRLQYEELAKAKAKGINDIVTNCDANSVRPAIRNSTGIHLWSAALDALGLWMCGPEDDDATVSTAEDTEFPPWEDGSDSNNDKDWAWEPPDLQEGQPWFQDRLDSLKMAVEQFPNAQQLYEEGVRALGRHWMNYLDEGPKSQNTIRLL
jgi:hypothetical protein